MTEKISVFFSTILIAPLLYIEKGIVSLITAGIISLIVQICVKIVSALIDRHFDKKNKKK